MIWGPSSIKDLIAICLVRLARGYVLISILFTFVCLIISVLLASHRVCAANISQGAKPSVQSEQQHDAPKSPETSTRQISTPPIQSTPQPDTLKQPESTKQENSTLDKWDKRFGILDKAARVLAVIGGAIFAYYKLIRGRVYKPRLELEISGSIISTDGSRSISVSMKLKNVGLSKVQLQQQSTLLRVSACKTEGHSPEIHKVEWEHLGTYNAFEKNEWIESGETIGDQLMFSIPAIKQVAFLLELRVVGSSTSMWREKSSEWLESKLIEMTPDQLAKMQLASRKANDKPMD